MVGYISDSGSAVLVCYMIAILVFWHRQACIVYIQSLWLDAGMAADPLLHIVVKLQGTEEQLCYTKASTLAVHVFKICKVRAKCQEGTLQDASGMDLVEDSTELSAGVYFFTPAESTGRSSVSTLCQTAPLCSGAKIAALRSSCTHSPKQMQLRLRLQT